MASSSSAIARFVREDAHHERTAETRVISTDEQSAPTPGRLSHALPADALRRDEIGRLHSFAWMMVGLSGFGMLLLPLLRADSIAAAVFSVTLLVVAVSYGWLAWFTSVPDRVRPLPVSIVAQVQGLASLGASFYFGVFSPYPALVAIGIYVYALGGKLRHTFSAYLNLAIGQAILSGAIMSGAVADRGLVTAGGLGVREQIAIQLSVQAVFLIALVLGRMARRRTLQTVAELDRAVRGVAQREALLAEARLALGRAAGLGGPGRFTDQELGSFRLGNVIGRGGVGEIYEANHIETGKPAAVKLLLYGGLAAEAEVARFIRETRIAASLSVKNVVRVLEVSDLHAPIPYLAMELLDGRDLGQILRRKSTLSPVEVAGMVGQVARGLEAAHAAGIVHRDLKPQNLFLTRAGKKKVWKILDFGVSKLTDDQSNLTEGMVVGTPAYMAPEQADGADVDRRADVYSLAVIAYRALTGYPAFSGSSVPRILYSVVHQMPARPGSLTTLPEEVDLVLSIALAKDPARRFASADELATALVRATRGEISHILRARANAVLRQRPWRASR
jgi:serine/threonine-protein kinase